MANGTTTGFVPYQLQPGIDLYVLPTTKFKTTGIWAYLHVPLTEETVTANTLASMVLPRGSKEHPTTPGLARHLDDLYGAALYNDVSKRGDSHDLIFRLDVANEKFLPGEKGLLERAIKTLAGVVLEPATEAGGFNADYVKQEAKNLKELIDGLINEKRRYSYQRLLQEMCRGEAYGLYRYGKTEDIPGLTPTGLLKRYQEILQTARVDLFVAGDVEPDQVADLMRKYFVFPAGAGPRQRPGSEVRRDAGPVRKVEEGQDVSQGVLCLGFRTGTAMPDDDYPASVVANGILGGFAHSKLFTNVREKHSLAYFSYSYLEGYKGLALMMSGIEFDNYQKTYDICLEQLEAVKKGDISDYEHDSTISALVNSIVSDQDDPNRMVESFLTGLFSGRPYEPEQRIATYRKVTKAQAAEAAKKFSLDTVYFLTKKGGQ